MSSDNPLAGDMLAAIDLGSNSFHMIVARLADDGGVQIIDRLKEMVRLGAGLDKRNRLSEESQQKALDCLARFGERIKDFPADNVRIVGTNTLRKAKNSKEFLIKAQALLGHSIDIISGLEEARLVHLGVSHTIADDGQRRLIVDIGGGSTETIIGEKFRPLLMESLFMGCVSITKKYFGDGVITKKQMKKADVYCRRELERVAYPYLKSGWDVSIGTSGSIRSIAKVVVEEGLSQNEITADSMKQLKSRLLEAGSIDNIKLNGLSEERRPVFIGGFVVLKAVFKSLKITTMEFSDGALREGALYDLLGRIKHEDVRENTVQRMMERYSLQSDHAENIAATSLRLYDAVSNGWGLKNHRFRDLLRWAALLHELGLTIAHAGYHRHGAYVVRNSDMPGFSVQDQLFLSVLIHTHRQKFDLAVFGELSEKEIQPAMKLSVLLRLAVIIHRSRSDIALPEISVKAGEESLQITFPDEWLDNYMLISADLNNEKELLEKRSFKLKFK